MGLNRGRTIWTGSPTNELDEPIGSLQIDRFNWFFFSNNIKTTPVWSPKPATSKVQTLSPSFAAAISLPLYSSSMRHGLQYPVNSRPRSLQASNPPCRRLFQSSQFPIVALKPALETPPCRWKLGNHLDWLVPPLSRL